MTAASPKFLKVQALVHSRGEVKGMGFACLPGGGRCDETSSLTQKDLLTIPEPSPTSSAVHHHQPQSSKNNSSSDWQSHHNSSEPHASEEEESVFSDYFRDQISKITSSVKKIKETYKNVKVTCPIDYCPILVISVRLCEAAGKHAFPCRKRKCASTQPVRIHTLLDSGSNINLVTVGLAKQLKLDLHGPFKSSINTANGVHSALTYRCTLNFLGFIQLMCFTHQDLGTCPGSEFPVIPRFEEVEVATKQLHCLNGTYPRKDAQLDFS